MADREMSKTERDAYVREAIDGWNTWVNYWDRQTKYGKMRVTAYAFYRGTAQLYWRDFANDPRLRTFGNARTTTWLEGDAHVYNFGAFCDDRGELIYGLNDFDESIVADYQLDLWRLAVSLVLVARQNDNLSDSKTAAVVNALGAKYLEAMRDFMTDKDADKAPWTEQTAYGKLDDFLEVVKSDDSSKKMLDKWAPKGDDGVRAFDLKNSKLGSATEQEKQAILDAMDGYWASLQPDEDTPASAVSPDGAKVLDIVHRLLAGTGSLGTPRYYLLLQDGDGEQHILDVKQQFKPSAYEFVSDDLKADYDRHADGNDARAHAVACRALSEHPDPFLGWMKLDAGWFSVRQRSPFKESFPALLADATGDYKQLKLDSETRYTKLAEQWGYILAADHAYAERVEAEERGDKRTLEAQVTAATSDRADKFIALVRTIAFEYADQVKADWEAFVDGLGEDIVPVE